MAIGVFSLLANGKLGLKTGEAIDRPRKRVSSGFSSDFSPLEKGRIHQWHTAGADQGQAWYPPLTLFAKLVCLAKTGGRVLWIGRKCWPSFQLLSALAAGDACRLMEGSVFLDPLTDDERFWAIGQGLRCAGAGCVIADGSGMDVTASRRLQLAAESGKVLGLIARPSWEIDEPTYAATRWLVQPHESADGLPRWDIELKSCRGQPVGQDAPRRWTVDWTYQVFRGTGTLHFSPDVGCGPAASQVGTHLSGRHKIA